VFPVVKPINASLTYGDGVDRVPSLKRSPGGGCGPWVAVGLVAGFVPKRGSVVWGRAKVSPAVVSVVLHAPMPFVARISSTVRYVLGRVLYAFSNVDLVTKFCHIKCVVL
jgi:hypothetical protein